MRIILRLAAVAALLLLLVAPALAQGRLFLTDPGRRLDQGAIEDAAGPLLSRGALVAIYLVQSGDDADFIERLIEDGLVRPDGTARSNMIGIYVALDQRFSSIRFGDEWSDGLAVNNNFDLIRQDQLNPGLSDGDYTGAFVTALDAIENAIANPPNPGGGTVINVDPAEAFGDFVLPTAGIAAVAAGLGVGGVALARRRRAQKIRATAEQGLKEAREGAGALIAQLGQRFKNAEEKAAFDKVSYAPPEVARLAKLQDAARQRFVAVQTAFDDVGEGLERYERPTNEQLNQAAAAYTKVRDDAQTVGEQIGQVEQARVELDRLAQQAPGEIDRAKKS